MIKRLIIIGILIYFFGIKIISISNNFVNNISSIYKEKYIESSE